MIKFILKAAREVTDFLFITLMISLGLAGLAILFGGLISFLVWDITVLYVAVTHMMGWRLIALISIMLTLHFRLSPEYKSPTTNL